MDLPTGVSRLKTRDLPAIQDEDLVALQRFGEGFDVNPTVIVYRSFGDWGLGGGIGYLWAGEYDPTENIRDDDFNPGDELSVNVLGDVFMGDVWRLVGRVAYTHFTADERGGVEIFREGDELDIGVSLEWRPEPWWAVVSVRDIYRFKAERLNAVGQLGEEPQNSNGNEIRGVATVGYIIDDVWTVRGILDVRYVAANDYATSARSTTAAASRSRSGPGSRGRSAGRSRSMRASAGTTSTPSAAPSSRMARTINGVHADMRVTYRF